MDPVTNFGYSSVLTPPSPAISGTTLVLASGEGSRFPDPSTDGEFNLVISPSGGQPLPSNTEIVRVTARTADTLTIERSQESTSARVIIAGDQVTLTRTALFNQAIKDIVKNRNIGVVSIPTLTDNGNGTFSLADDGVIIFTPETDGDSINVRLTVGASGTLTPTDGLVNYLYCDYNSGSPTYALTTDSSIFLTDATKVPVFRISRDGNELCPLNYDEYGISPVAKMIYKDVGLNGFERLNGLILSTIAPRVCTVSAGYVWFALDLLMKSENVAGTTGTLYEYYLSAGSWVRSTALSAYDATYYSDGTNRQTLDNNKYVSKYFFRVMGDTNCVSYIHGDQYNTVAEALAEPIPTPPSVLSGSALYVGKIVIQKNATNGTAYPRQWDSTLASQAVTSHSDLADLGNDDHTQYYNLTRITSWFAGKDLADLGTKSHTDLDDIGTNTHPQIDTHIASVSNPHGVTKTQVGLSNVTNDAQIPLSQKGVANGVAELGADGLVPSAQLPSFVDDVIDSYIVGATPYASDWLSESAGGSALTPEAGKIYVVLTAGTYENKTYRWSGTVYVEISESLALGETSSTAYRGDRGKIAYDHSQIANGNPHNIAFADLDGNLVLSEIDPTDLAGSGAQLLTTDDDGTHGEYLIKFNSQGEAETSGIHVDNVLTDTNTKTVSNKSINANSNTITNIGASEVEKGVILDQTYQSSIYDTHEFLIADFTNGLRSIEWTDIQNSIIHDRTAQTALQDTDEFVFYDTSETQNQKITFANLKSAVIGSNSFNIDQSGGTGDTKGSLSGSINGTNKVFEVSDTDGYVSGSLEVYLNGQLQTEGSSEDYVETSASAGTFTFDVAPVSGDEIVVAYKSATSTTGNADTVDGYEASAFAKQTEWASDWKSAGETWTYASANTFTIVGDKTSKYQKGDKIWLKQSSSSKWFYVIDVTYSSPNTTIKVTAGNEYSLANSAITDPYYSRAVRPFGFPTWFDYTPSFGGSGSMTVTYVGNRDMQFKIDGKSITVVMKRVQLTTAGTADKYITFSLPVDPLNAGMGTGCWLYDNSQYLTGSFFQESGTTSPIRVYKYDQSNWGIGSNRFFGGEITYEY